MEDIFLPPDAPLLGGGAGGAGLHAHRRQLRQGRHGAAPARGLLPAQNREIFETIYSMFVYSKPIDGVTVAGEMEQNGTV